MVTKTFGEIIISLSKKSMEASKILWIMDLQKVMQWAKVI